MARRLELIRRLEQVGLATWPALEIEHYDGWDLRAAAGVTKRSNSASPLEPSTLPLEAKIAHCEHWFAARRLPACFRLTPGADPALEPMLARRGYAADPVVDVMVHSLDGAATPPPGVQLEEHPSNEWFERFMESRFEPGTSRTVVRSMLQAGTAPMTFASIRGGGDIAAFGIGALHDGHVAVYAMHTVPEMRRRGLATLLLNAVLAWGAAGGADTAFLQVHSETPGAHALYTSAGFTTAYRYWYRTAQVP